MRVTHLQIFKLKLQLFFDFNFLSLLSFFFTLKTQKALQSDTTKPVMLILMNVHRDRLVLVLINYNGCN